MILFCGDPHGNFGGLLARVEAARPDAIVLLGDQTPDQPLADILGPWAARTWYILGNHDSDREEYLAHHLDSMPDRNLHGRVRPVAGMRVGGLGGVPGGGMAPPESATMDRPGGICPTHPSRPSVPERPWAQALDLDFPGGCAGPGPAACRRAGDP